MKKSWFSSLMLVLGAANFAHASGSFISCSPNVSEAFDRTSVTISASNGVQFIATLNQTLLSQFVEDVEHSEGDKVAHVVTAFF